MTSEPSRRETFVHIVLPGETNFTVAARFRVTRTPTRVHLGEFVYGASYLDRPNAVELDPAELTLGSRVRETVRLKGFFGAIRDAMPDAWGRRLIERRLGRGPLDEFDYLLGGDVDRVGALGFGSDASGLKASVMTPDILSLERLAESVDSLIREETHPDAQRARDLLLPGSSLGGARPKITVQDGDDLWLAKFAGPDDRWDEPRVEHGLLWLAGECGLRAARSRLIPIGGRAVLLVGRFDRTRTDAGFLRARFVSGLTLLRAEESATARERWSYLLLADEVRRASSSPRADLRELFARMCFNAAVSNTDDHPRNHGVVGEQRGWRLSPAYDLTPTPTISREPPFLAMECGTQGRAASRRNLLSGAGRFLLRQPEAEGILDSVVGTVRSSWREAMRRAGVSIRDVERIAPALSTDLRPVSPT